MRILRKIRKRLIRFVAASIVGGCGNGLGTTTTYVTGPNCGLTTSCVKKTLKESKSAKAAASGSLAAVKATSNSPTAATAAVNKAVNPDASAPPGFHLAWVPNQKVAAMAKAAPVATTVVKPNAWNWRSLARAQLTGPPPKTIYTSENSYPYISGPYVQGSTNLFRPL